VEVLLAACERLLSDAKEAAAASEATAATVVASPAELIEAEKRLGVLAASCSGTARRADAILAAVVEVMVAQLALEGAAGAKRYR